MTRFVRFAHQMKTLLSVGLCAVATAVVFGCASGSATMSSAQRIAVADFSQQREQPSADDDAAEHIAPGQLAHAESADPVAVRPPLVATDDRKAAAATPTTVTQTANRHRRRPGDVYIVDSLIGQVNGRSLYADAFFRPIEDQLRQLRRSIPDNVMFIEEVRKVVADHLWLHVRDELFLAEAESSLSPEEQQGLFAFMRYLREDAISKGRGTRAVAEQRIQDSAGMTLDQYAAATRDAELVRKLLHEKLLSRVIVSWRDVQREYHRRASEFNPPPTLYLSRLRVSADDEATIAEVNAALFERGESFEDVVERYGRNDDGPWQGYRVGPEGLHDIVAGDAIRNQLIGREIGETTKPVRSGSTMYWFHLERLEQISRSLYDIDVQRGLMRELEAERLSTEENRYIRSLYEGIEQELNLMRDRLLEIAIHRYGTRAS